MRAVFAAGCFWGVEYNFSKIEGVTNTKVGYSGGNLENPTYEDVCSGKTGHAEAVLVDYDTKKATYTKLLEEFFKMHDPTQKNRQGHDSGTQYRSAIFFSNQKQKKEAENLLKDMQRNYPKKIETQIVKFNKFYEAEKHHQKYLEKKGKIL
jgi:peptide-methionine (S)-S-oxide reductase